MKELRKSRAKLACILPLVAIVSLTSCQRAEGDRASQEQPATGSSNVPAAPAPPAKEDPKDVSRFIAEVVPYIQSLRESSVPYHAQYPIKELFTVWNPVGKTTQELKSMIGEPSYSTKDKLDYTLLTAPIQANGGYVFEFYFSDGRITKFESYSLE